MDIRFLHTSPANEKLFRQLIGTSLHSSNVTHFVREGFLLRAQAGNEMPALTSEIKAFIVNEINDGADLIVCTCSTLGTIAESTAPNVLRVDRPMAANAAKHNRLLIVAAVESTLVPTRSLIEDETQKAGTDPELEILLVENAWQHFLDGNHTEYYNKIAGAVNSYEGDVDAILLAQASMYGATHLIRTGKPVLNSPDAFIAHLNQLGI